MQFKNKYLRLNNLVHLHSTIYNQNPVPANSAPFKTYEVFECLCISCKGNWLLFIPSTFLLVRNLPSLQVLGSCVMFQSNQLYNKDTAGEPL